VDFNVVPVCNVDGRASSPMNNITLNCSFPHSSDSECSCWMILSPKFEGIVIHACDFTLLYSNSGSRE
jgi:hypothetical protein